MQIRSARQAHSPPRGPSRRQAQSSRQSQSSRQGQSPRQGQLTLAAVGIVLLALNLRPTITSLGAVLDRIQDDIGLSGTIAGVATTMPVLAFATVGACVPALVKRTGLIPGVLLANALLAAGLILRAVTGTSVVWLLIWTAVATSGIAIANVLLPSLVSQFSRAAPGR